MTKSFSDDKPPSEPKPKPMRKAKAPRGKEEERGLRDYYNLGVKLYNAYLGEDRKSLTEVARSLATQENPELMVRQARTLVTRYSPAEFEELCRLRTPDNKPLTVSHARPLMTIEDKKMRTTLQERAAKEGWGVERLKKEIKKHQPRGSQGSPPLRKPTTLADLLDQIEKQTEDWLVRYKKAWDKGESELFMEVQVSTADERKELQESLDTLPPLLSQLIKNAKNLKKHVETIEIGMKRPEEAAIPKSDPGTAAGKAKKRPTR
jgi:hypothetical protein